MPLVSVIVPVYNAEKYIEKCLDSIVNQTFEDFEVIVIDDGSTDTSGIVAEEFVKKFGNVKVYHKENEGLISARIDGIKYANGEYISFVDADDWIEIDFLEGLMREITQHNADIVVSGCIQERNDISLLKVNQFEEGIYTKQQMISEIYPKMLFHDEFFVFGILPYMWNKIYKKELLLKCYENINVSIYDGEDVAVVYPYLLHAEKLIVLKEAKYHYSIHNTSMSVNKKDDYFENVSLLYLHLNQKFKESNYFSVLLPQLEQYMRLMVWQKEPERFIKANKHVFPFSKVPKDAKIILYGAGLVGKNYFYQVQASNYCEIVSWVDKNYDDIKMSRMKLCSPESIKRTQCDFTVIAIDNNVVKHKVKEFLFEIGIENNRIIM